MSPVGQVELTPSGFPGELNAVSLPLTVFPANKLSAGVQRTPNTGS